MLAFQFKIIFQEDSFVWNTNMAAMTFVEVGPWKISANALSLDDLLK
jgi:hypothetical protein